MQLDHPAGRYLADDFVVNCCVKRGKWYYEVKFEGNVELAIIGWITGEYRKRGIRGIEQTREGYSWVVLGPDTRFVHRLQISNPPGAFVRPSWGGGMVVGCMADLENNTMEFVFNGKRSGIVFSGFDPGDGLYPAMSLNDTTCTINLGQKPFEFKDPIEKLGYSAFEHPAIKERFALSTRGLLLFLLL